MRLYIIFGLRKESYEGQHAPEALEVMDEYSYEENAEWLNNKLSSYKAEDEFMNVEIVTVNISHDKLDKIMRKQDNEIEGEIE